MTKTTKKPTKQNKAMKVVKAKATKPKSSEPLTPAVEGGEVVPTRRKRKVEESGSSTPSDEEEERKK